MQTDNSTPRPEGVTAQTYTPAIVAASLVLIAWGAVTTFALIVLGLLLLAVGIGGWIVEIRRER